MNKFGTVCSVIIMLLAAIAGFFAGMYLDQQPIEGAILFVVIAGFACVIYNGNGQQ